MIVPCPTRSQHKIAASHECALSIDRRVGFRSLKKQAERACGVAVSVGPFPRHQKLQTGEQRACDLRPPGQTRILEDEHAPLRLLSREQRTRSEQARTNDGVFPVHWPGRWLRRARHKPRNPLPERGEILLHNLIVKSFPRV